jgi:hypothetical protein
MNSSQRAVPIRADIDLVLDLDEIPAAIERNRTASRTGKVVADSSR